MARSLASRLDRLERLAHDLLNQQQAPVYVREGTEGGYLWALGNDVEIKIRPAKQARRGRFLIIA
jgi:hypothetical protein